MLPKLYGFPVNIMGERLHLSEHPRCHKATPIVSLPHPPYNVIHMHLHVPTVDRVRLLATHYIFLERDTFSTVDVCLTGHGVLVDVTSII